MATFTTRPGHPFPAGTSVAAYEDIGQKPEGTPNGLVSADTSPVGTDASLSFDNLVEGKRYYAVAQVGGVYRWVGFRVPVVPDLPDEADFARGGDLVSLRDELAGRIEPLENGQPWATITDPIGIYTGAVGDGATDNTAVIEAHNAALEAQGGGVLYVPGANPGFVTSGHVLTNVSVLGDVPTRGLLGIVRFSSRLIHKAGSTTPLIEQAGGVTASMVPPTGNNGFERVHNVTLQGRQKANITAPKRAIVSAASRTQFTVAVGDLPPAPSNVGVFPFYGICAFFDANGHRLGTGIVQSVNGGTGQVTLVTGTDNYTGITGSGNLLTSTEKVAFAPRGTWSGDGFTHTDESDSTMLGPPAILVNGRDKIIGDVDIRDFWCSIVLQTTVGWIGRVYSHNHAMAAIAQRALGSGGDLWCDHLFAQGRVYEGYGEPARSIGVIDTYGMQSLCALWGTPGSSTFTSLAAEGHVHCIIEKGGGDGTHFDYLLVDGCFKEPFVVWGGTWVGGTSGALHDIDYLEVRTLQSTYTAWTAPNYPSGARNIFAMMATDGHSKWDVNTMSVKRFDAGATLDYASAVAYVGTPANGFHEVRIRSIPWQAALTNKAVAWGKSPLPGAYTLHDAPLIPNTYAEAANVGRITRFTVERDMVVTSLAFSVTVAAGADDAVDVGIYNAAGVRLVSSGATTGKLNSTGRKTVAITPITLRAGQFYYFALSTGALGGTAATLMGASPTAAAAGQLFGATIGLVETDAANGAHPLPANWVIGGVSAVGALGAVLE